VQYGGFSASRFTGKRMDKFLNKKEKDVAQAIELFKLSYETPLKKSE
jgi:hypothetical protein